MRRRVSQYVSNFPFLNVCIITVCKLICIKSPKTSKVLPIHAKIASRNWIMCEYCAVTKLLYSIQDREPIFCKVPMSQVLNNLRVTSFLKNLLFLNHYNSEIFFKIIFCKYAQRHKKLKTNARYENIIIKLVLKSC